MDLVQRRDRLYRGTVIAAMLFAVVTCGVLICFKSYEEYFDSHGRIAVVAEAALVEQKNAALSSIRKRNFKVTIVDEPGAGLVIPFAAQTQKSNISISEEFTQNKLVITLKNGTSYIKEGATLTSDSDWMDAVGVYRHEQDIVIEVYCLETSGYQMAYENERLTLSFLPLREQYAHRVVVYVPWSNRNHIHRNEWIQTVQKLEEEYPVKIFSSISMQEEYTAESVAEFANQIHADMVVGMELVDSEQEEVVTLCNPDYFIPEFGNVELAALQEQEYAQKTGLHAVGIKRYDETQSWIGKLRVPAALTQFSFPLGSEHVEQTYHRNQQMMGALESMIKQMTETYWTAEEALEQ